MIAQVGPLTTVVEAAATAVGAGIVLGGFVLGVTRQLAGRSRESLQASALTDGYIGGLCGAVAILADVIMRYIM